MSRINRKIRRPDWCFRLKNAELGRLFGLALLLLLHLGFGSDSAAQVPVVSEELVASRMARLDAATPISLIYNAQVQAYIDVYTRQRQEHLAAIIGRAELYFPLFEEQLDKMGLPLELKYLAVVESALEPRARSSSGAVGLWQFLYQAGRMFDLEVSSYLDERADPVKSTKAACRYLKYLYDNFQDWHLVLAAYNGGIGVVNEAIVKAGGERDYWKIRPYLSAETRGYVPAFIAVNYAMNHYHDYGIVPTPAPFRYEDLGFAHLGRSVSFEQLAALIEVDVTLLRLLNPVFLRDYIPVIDEPVEIALPREKLLLFFEQRHLLQEEAAPPSAGLPPIGERQGRHKIIHTVRKGEFFHRIAMSYGVRVEDVQHWNRLSSRHLKAGQQLEIWKKPAELPLFYVDRSWLKEAGAEAKEAGVKNAQP